ncbi:DUF3108 domain-containing protein [Shewanella spartinae]|uniref:DUF3108 domain-containing protein n=1 Tax=Shewanella spartinae TaxID=2864205 RepID=UPI001C656934|nr:DUF3108 domain-containing protein [Shewanella spartinae]QYJ95824.1 DUF3108 domain-containing protein [Shewanella spartinae]
MISSFCAIALTAQADEYPLTPHTAEYQVNYGSIELGKARYQLPAPQGNLYQYRFDSDVSLLMLWDKRTVISTFSKEGEQLIPMRFTHNRNGTGSDYQEQSAYVLDQKLVHSRYKDERAKFPYTPDLFDPLMVQLQFRLDIMKGSNKLHYKMLKSGEIDEYDFKVVGKERMVIASGTYETVKIEVVRDNDKRQTFFWMSPELGYLPVRLTHFEKGSKQLDITLLNYQYSEPTMAQTSEQTNKQASKQANQQSGEQAKALVDRQNQSHP